MRQWTCKNLCSLCCCIFLLLPLFILVPFQILGPFSSPRAAKLYRTYLRNKLINLSQSPFILQKNATLQSNVSENLKANFEQNSRCSAIDTIYMSYTVYGGLCNQLWSHVSAISISRRLGAVLVLATGWSRATFAEPSKLYPQPVSTILDVNKMISNEDLYMFNSGYRILKVSINQAGFVEKSSYWTSFIWCNGCGGSLLKCTVI